MLTPSGLQVTRAILTDMRARGMSWGEIAKHLGVGCNTVRSYRRNLGFAIDPKACGRTGCKPAVQIAQVRQQIANALPAADSRAGFIFGR